jgi:prepilin peptidase CpaA
MITLSFILILLMGIVVYFDATRFIIPNWLNGMLLALYPVYYFLSPEPIDIKAALIIMGIVFVIGYLIFAANIMGGGDIKLITVLSLWAGPDAAMPFLVYTALLGGMLATFLMTMRPTVGAYLARHKKIENLPRILVPGEPLPYGLAIAAGFVIPVLNGTLPGLPVITTLRIF